MEREVPMTVELIKSVSDKFSLEIIFILDLPGVGIREISGLEQCINLLHLNLSHNRINRIRGISTCTELVLLDLSYNEIIRIEGLRPLVKLEKLDLSSNRINSLSGINDLQSLAKLRWLSFQQFDLNDFNPICREADYRSNILSLLTQITSLDGHRKKYAGILKEDLSKYEVSLKGVKLNMDNKPWVQGFSSKEDKALVDESDIRSVLRECKSLLNKGDHILSSIR